MRTTLTLDDDVAAKIRERCRRTGQSFKQVINDLLRSGLNTSRAAAPRVPYVVRARALGVKPGINLDDIGELLEQMDGAGNK
jgi:hypothetical protein